MISAEMIRAVPVSGLILRDSTLSPGRCANEKEGQEHVGRIARKNLKPRKHQAYLGTRPDDRPAFGLREPLHTMFTKYEARLEWSHRV